MYTLSPSLTVSMETSASSNPSSRVWWESPFTSGDEEVESGGVAVPLEVGG